MKIHLFIICLLRLKHVRGGLQKFSIHNKATRGQSNILLGVSDVNDIDSEITMNNSVTNRELEELVPTTSPHNCKPTASPDIFTVQDDQLAFRKKNLMKVFQLKTIHGVSIFFTMRMSIASLMTAKYG
jgi:hypothetical protein